ncbi:type II secretion system F family protein [uncultured Jatrophihabitans sp.]|uniref:type II secretion system F family protein n=1 Tax=uncultured Jatrophihabitans sp. TaxID=1610747 RepID=UPI0035CC3CFE
MTIGWLWLAGALLAMPPGRRRIRGRPRIRDEGSTPRRSLDGPHAAAVAAVLSAVACLVAVGSVTGIVVGVVVGPIVGLAVRAAARRPGAPRLDRSVALPLDLAAAVLRSGRPLADALSLAAPAAAAASADLLLRVAGLLRLGASAEDAWSLVPAAHSLRPLAMSAVRSADSGIRLADAFERHAAELRAEAIAAATARAQRAGITAMAPLAACFLPSFVCLGVVPIVVGMATNALGVLA